MNNFLASELILNEDSSVYHLKLNNDDIADTIITVGDQQRVSAISKHFDRIDVCKSNREFVTHTGSIASKRITVISTGIGADNMDIVFNELDQLASIDLNSRVLLKNRKKLKIIRLGTSGSVSKELDLNELVFSKYAIGIDGIPAHYEDGIKLFQNNLSNEFYKNVLCDTNLARPYSVKGSEDLWTKLYCNQHKSGITLTSNGFYGPQGRTVRVTIKNRNLLNSLQKLSYDGLNLTNIEMETAGIYALGNIFDHDVLSISTVLAHRLNGTFSSNPEKAINQMITYALSKIETIA